LLPSFDSRAPMSSALFTFSLRKPAGRATARR
jgi:hypothetical protein